MTSPISFFLWREQVSKKEISAILHILLKRQPLVFVGRNTSVVDSYVKVSANLLPHRNKVSYGIDVLKKEEIEDIELAEKHNYDLSRTIIFSLSNYTSIAVRNFSKFKGWILGTNSRDEKRVLSVIRENNENVTIFNVDAKRVIYAGDKSKDHRFEKHLLEDIIKRTDIATSRLIRIIEKKVKIPNTPFAREILNFDEEREKIEQEILEDEILSFVHAARRLLALLLRLRMIKEFSNEGIIISEKSITDAIGYNKAQIRELLDLIKWEWNESFYDLVTKDKDQEIGDWIDSLWV